MSREGNCGTLYYDGSCPLCQTEIAKLRRLGDASLVLTDIHSLSQDDTVPDRDTLLRDLHFRTADNRLLTGVDANVAAWQHTRYGFLFRWLRWPLIRPVANLVYRRWADWRYRRLYGAQAEGVAGATEQR